MLVVKAWNTLRHVEEQQQGHQGDDYYQRKIQKQMIAAET